MIHRTLVATLIVAATAAAAHAEDAPPPPAPYSLPWQLRPAANVSVLRSDTVVADYEDAKGNDGTTILTGLIYGQKVNDKLGTILRVAYVDNDPPVGEEGRGYVNPVVGATYLLKPSQDLRVSLFLGLAIPLGQGAGNTPNAATKAAVGSGVLARSAMDNAMFAVNDVVLFPGVGVAWVKNGFTFQYEATVLQLKRVRGDRVQVDENKTNFTTGIHAGYFFTKHFSLGADLRYQRWLSTPAAVEANEDLRDNVSTALGPRFHVKVGDKKWLRPGIAYAVGLHGPIDDQEYRIIQIDVPFYF